MFFNLELVAQKDFVITSAGNVGIGTDNPICKLVINSGTTDLATQIVSDDANVFLAFKDGDSTGNQQVQIGGIGNNFVAYAGGSERMRITSAGLFGIGTNAPGNLLQVEGSAPVIAIRDTASHSAYSNGGKIYFQGKDSDGNVKTFGGVLGVSQSSNNGQLRLQTRTGGTLYDRLTINATGNCRYSN